MFNLLIDSDNTAWVDQHHMSMPISRVKEHSGTEANGIDLNNPVSLRSLERIDTILMYERGIDEPEHTQSALVGNIRGIRHTGDELQFRFFKTGEILRETVFEHRHLIQLGDWERNRTHWAIKDGTIPRSFKDRITSSDPAYDIVLSFAGEDRAYVEQVADYLDQRGIIVFYDKYERAELWGTNLIERLDRIYQHEGRYCVMFISQHYADKVWTTHERRAALTRAILNLEEYVLPARFDDTPIDGLNPAIGFEDCRTTTPEELGEIIIQKIGIV